MSYEPGDNMTVYWDDGRVEPTVVMATSRHQRTLSKDEAREKLKTLWSNWDDDTAADLSTIETYIMRSVVKDDLYFIEADQGSFHSEGSGKRWIKVMRCNPA